jgi:hypothetical protein
LVLLRVDEGFLIKVLHLLLLNLLITVVLGLMRLNLTLLPFYITWVHSWYFYCFYLNSLYFLSNRLKLWLVRLRVHLRLVTREVVRLLILLGLLLVSAVCNFNVAWYLHYLN